MPVTGAKLYFILMYIGVSISLIKRYNCPMKHIFFAVIAVVIFCTGFSGCNKGKPAANPSDGSFGKDPSYALGMNIGSSLKADGLYLDWDEFLQGMKDILYDNDVRFTMEEASQIFYEAYNANNEKRESERIKQAETDSAENRQAGIDFFEKNKQNPGVISVESGLQYEVIIPGDGPKPTVRDTVRVHYRGTLINGNEFDSSYSRGQPAEFPLEGVIPGWTEGLQLMNVGSKYRLFIPSDLGYGPQGAGPHIPPNSALIFEVELLDIVHD
jgi:FKBP-type peptidyl-prolyl cis-trans isomerase